METKKNKKIERDRVHFLAKTAFPSFDLILKVDQLAPNHKSEKTDGHLEFPLNWPFGFQETMTSYGLGFSQ